MSWESWRVRLARSSEPTAAQVARVRRALDVQLASTAPLLREGSEPGPVQIARVKARLRARRQPMGWAVPALGGLALAAAALFAFRGAVAEPEVRTVPLAGQLALTDRIAVDADGAGTAHGAADVWSLDWERGTVALSVAPGTGQQVAVNTREAQVRVIGTAFTVARDALGTTVAVTEGRVAVDCVAGADHELGAGERAECAPGTAAGLLGRAHAQAERGDGPAEQLATLDRALELPAEPAIRAEIEAARLRPLVALDRSDEARAAAERYLAAPDAPRAPEVHRLAGRLAIAAGDCDAAIDHLTNLQDRTPDEAAWLARCAAR